MRSVDVFSKSTRAVAAIRTAFDDYMRQGGFPELQFISDDKEYISELVNDILRRDIEQRFKISYTASFEQLEHHLLNVSPSIVVDKNLQEVFNLKSQHTAKNYVSYLKQAYLLVGLHKFSAKSRQRVVGSFPL